MYDKKKYITKVKKKNKNNYKEIENLSSRP